MSKGMWAWMLGVALVISASIAMAAPPIGCCVCSDGRCLEGISGMQGCVEKCAKKNATGAAFNANATCWGSCGKVRAQVRRDAKKGGGR
jgi:hypothetical protein